MIDPGFGWLFQSTSVSYKCGFFANTRALASWDFSHTTTFLMARLDSLHTKQFTQSLGQENPVVMEFCSHRWLIHVKSWVIQYTLFLIRTGKFFWGSLLLIFWLLPLQFVLNLFFFLWNIHVQQLKLIIRLLESTAAFTWEHDGVYLRARRHLLESTAALTWEHDGI